MNDPYETTESHLDRLLGRALNSFDLPDTTVDRLGTALTHASSLHSSHHSAALHRTTYRHTYLLADGSSVTLWELVHDSGRDGAECHELYAEEAEARLAASRLRGSRPERLGTVLAPGLAAGTGPDTGFDAGFDADLDDELDAGLELAGRLLATPPVAPARAYVPDDSADHARRLLRRAENPDRPGEETARRLRSAFAHHISQALGRPCPGDGRDAGFTLYEHAFLLLDGTELSLWEVEHTATPDGRHMCEVYADERTARGAMELRARVR
ncbi:DUF6227 family protein [Streptomyces sp. FIT100]|uniref:DUF6227 family protein n=1 Tax=Streptomyces sp. FIT100 TaxID=2837956 RepID=UPI0021C7AADA|nr:DUF6227 family protein [Streptomyces sp. FIT100]UUN27392.1 hypothetical protein KK483_14030 [Streptomyces sp. FIT100]